jgi:hypothetical protein
MMKTLTYASFEGHPCVFNETQGWVLFNREEGWLKFPHVEILQYAKIYE